MSARIQRRRQVPSGADDDIRGASPHAVFILPNLNGGGAERAALNLHQDSTVTTTIVVERSEGDLLEDEAAADAIDAGIAPKSGRSTRIRRLTTVLRTLRPDVVVAPLSPLVVMASTRLAHSRRQRRPKVLLWLQNPAAGFVPGATIGGLTPIGVTILRALGASVDGVAGAAEGLTDEFRRAHVPARKLTVLPNGLLLPAGAPDRCVWAPGAPLELLSIGRLAAQKRHDIALQALVILREHVDARLTILGRGEEDRRLRGLATALGVADSVVFQGFVQDPRPFMRRAHIFCLTSDFEGFGNVIVEAMSHNLPAVVTDVPYGPAFVAGDVPSVRLVPPADPQAVARATLDLCRQMDRLDTRPAMVRARAFEISHVAEHFRAIVAALDEGRPLPLWTFAR